MIGNKLQENENIKPNSLEMRKLKETFPQYFNNKGEFEIDKFKDFLKQEEVEISKEGHELKFLGKSYAKYLSSLETETYISPDIKHNSKEENKDSENLYIVGDNIDALKHLLSSYTGEYILIRLIILEKMDLFILMTFNLTLLNYLRK